MIEVCCAIIIHQDKMLAVQRGPESSHPWKWEFPGGKMNAFETPEQCIVREIKEELTVIVETAGQLEPIDFDYGTKAIRLIPFLCRIMSGEINLTEHVSMRWMEWDKWEEMDWAEADRKLILKNLDQLEWMFS